MGKTVWLDMFCLDPGDGLSAIKIDELLAETIRSVDDHLPDGTILVLAMDEVPIAISNIAANEDADAAGQLLQSLRALRRRESCGG